jgi:myo-inositol 2-dehydrogenase / D-chiro-inositol 1-dehydrogenase
MKPNSSIEHPVTSRRGFLKTSGTVIAGTALAPAVYRPGYAAESNTIKIALVGCGGRGTGAAGQALSTEGPTRLVAMADVFEQRLQGSLGQLRQGFADKVAVPPDRQFAGLEGFRKAIDVLDRGDVVLLATPPAFRPRHVEYAVAKGINVFMEKSFAVDGPGIRRVLRAGQEARRQNLKIASGLMSRHSLPLEQAIEQIHQGAIGPVITAWAYRMHGPVGVSPRRPGMSELAYQIANYSNFTWVNGSFIVDWLIHNIDVCCWVKDAWPVSAQGMGGRQTRTGADQLFDQYFAEYTYPDGTRMAAQGRHIANCYDFFGCIIQGATGSAVLGEGITDPRLYRGHQRAAEDVLWRFRGEPSDQYQREHDLFFDAIRNDRPYNETERSAKSNLVAIMGRMACESGQTVTYDAALNSDLELAPGLDRITSLDGEAPVMPDGEGRYPIAMPGQTRAV